MKHFLIQPTWRCQNRCSYCWVNQTVLTRPVMAAAAERPMEDWARAIERDRPDLIDVAGGEPLLLPWLPDLFAACPTTRFGLSTNGIDLEGARRLVVAAPRNLIAVNVSYHPESARRFRGYEQRFKQTVLLLKSAYRVHSNLVLAGDNAEAAREMGSWLRAAGIHVALSPYEESAELGTLLDSDLVCRGGIDHLNVAPDGSCWPCLTTMRSPYWAETCLGNWLDGTLDISRKPRPCHLACHDYYVLRTRHESGDLWGVEAQLCES